MIETVEIKGRIYENQFKTLDLFSPKKSEDNNMPIFWANIFGQNGSGKSTLSHALWDYCNSLNHCGCEIRLKPNDGVRKDKIYVFNEDFINRKVRFSQNENLDAIVMLDDQVVTQESIDENKNELSEKESEYAKSCFLLDKSSDYHFENKDGIISFSQKNKDIEKEARKAFANWSEKDREIKGNRKRSDIKLEDFKKDLEKIKKRNPNACYNHAKEELLNQNIQKFLDLSDDVIKLQEININNEVDLKKCLSEIEREIFSVPKTNSVDINDSIITLLQNSDVNLEKTKNFFMSQKQSCPLCMQSIDEEWREKALSAISELSNQNTILLKKQKLQNLLNMISSYCSINDASLNDVPDFIKIEEYKTYKAKYVSSIESVKALLCEKISSPFSILTIEKKDGRSMVEENHLRLKACVQQLNEEFKAYNNQIDQHEDVKRSLLVKLRENEILRNERIIQEYIDIENEKQREEFFNKGLEKNISQLKYTISGLELKMSSTQVAMDKINFFLKVVLLKSKRLELMPAENGYTVLSRGHKVKLHDLSSGEKNIIALAYFFAQPYSGHRIDESLQDDYLFVLDDPITSMDRSNEIGLYSLIQKAIKDFSKKCSKVQVCILTHSVPVMQACEKMPKAIWGKNALSRNRLLENGDLKLETPAVISNYRVLIKDVYSFAKSGNSNSYYSLGNEMRRALEEYSNFNFNIGGTGLFTNEFISKQLEKAVKDNVIGEDTRELIGVLLVHLWMNSDSHGQEKVLSCSLDHSQTAFDVLETQRVAQLVLILLDVIHFTGLPGILFDNYDPNLKRKIHEINENLAKWKSNFEGDREKWTSILDDDFKQVIKTHIN